MSRRASYSSSKYSKLKHRPACCSTAKFISNENVNLTQLIISIQDEFSCNEPLLICALSYPLCFPCGIDVGFGDEMACYETPIAG
jgi:hypothetical protein